MSYFDEYRRGITSVRLMVDYFREQGVSVSRLLAGTGLAQGDLNDPNTEILARQELRVVANILTQVPDAQTHAAALGNRYHFSAYGLWGYGLVCCDTAAQAFSLALKYLPLTYAFSGIRYREAGNLGFLCFTPPPLEPEISQFVLVRDMMASALLVRELAGEDFRVERLTFASKEVPGDCFTRILGCPVHYGANCNEAAFPKTLLNRSLPQSNAVTAVMCEQQCRELIHRRRIHAGVKVAVEQFLRDQRWQKPVLSEVARNLNMSERSLKRHLQQEGASFRALVERFRDSEACRLLKQSDLSISEIALRLGFSDTSTFSQAFKRWQGASPTSYRVQSPAFPGGIRQQSDWPLTPSLKARNSGSRLGLSCLHRGQTMDIRLKRAYEDPARSDGPRVLVDRIWPRGVAKEDAKIAHWLKGLSPSTDLRKWFGHDPEKWPEFRERYLRELAAEEAGEDLQTLRTLLEDHNRITLVFAAKETEHNNAVALRDFILNGCLYWK